MARTDPGPKRPALLVTLGAGAALLLGGEQLGLAKGSAQARHGKASGLQDRAAQLRAQGAAALAKKDWAAAADALGESYRLSPEGKTLYLLGQLAWSSGKTVAAQDLMRRFLADPSSSEDPAAKSEADKIVDQPRPASGDVLVIGERGALVSVDDRIVGMLPLTLPLLLGSGEHKVTLEVSGRRLEGPVRVLPGRTAELRFNLGSDAVVARIVPAVVWVPDWKGVPGEAQKLLSKATEQSVVHQKLSLVSKGVALAQAPHQADCLAQLQCLEQLATLNEAGYTLTTSVEASGDLLRSDWTLKLALVDAPTGDYAASEERRCERCTADQVATILAEATAVLVQKGAARPKGTLEVLTDPPGADVLLTDRRLGQTPYVRTAFTGGYDMTLKLSGYPPVRQRLEVEDGKKATVRITLTPEGKAPPPPLPPPPPPPPPLVAVKPVPPPVAPPLSPDRAPRPTWRIITGAALLGGGALLGVYGATGVAADGDTVDVNGSPMRLHSGAPGAAFLGVGAAAAIVGAVLIALPGPRRVVRASLRGDRGDRLLRGQESP